MVLVFRIAYIKESIKENKVINNLILRIVTGEDY